MSFIPSTLYVGAPSGGPTLIYTGPGGSAQIIIKEIVLTNTINTMRSVSLWVVPSGGSPDNTNLFIGNCSVQPGSPFVLALSTMPGSSDLIYASSTNVAIRISAVIGP